MWDLFVKLKNKEEETETLGAAHVRELGSGRLVDAKVGTVDALFSWKDVRDMIRPLREECENSNKKIERAKKLLVERRS